MQHWQPIDGIAYYLRPMQLSDAQSMLAIRCDPSRNGFIHQTDPSIDKQEAWIRAKLTCDDDLTMVIVSKSDHAPKGFMSLYEIDEAKRTARQGRWLISPGSRCVSEFALLGYELIFERLRFHMIYAKIPAGHKTVIAFQTRLGAKFVETAPEYTSLEDGTHQLQRYELRKEAWPQMKGMLSTMVSRHSN